MTARNEDSVKKLVVMFVEVLNGEYSDTRDLAVVQLSIIGEKATPCISITLKAKLKESDMIEYLKLYKDWQQKSSKSFEEESKFNSIRSEGWCQLQIIPNEAE